MDAQINRTMHPTPVTLVRGPHAALAAVACLLAPLASGCTASTPASDPGVIEADAPPVAAMPATIGELQTAVRAASPGDTVILKDGVYTPSFTLFGRGEEGAPITIRSETPAGVNIRGAVSIEGAHLTIDGVTFTHGGAIRVNASDLRITRCTMDDVQSGKWIRVDTNAKRIRIDRNLFENKTINRELERGCQLIQLRVLNDDERHIVEYNHFRDIHEGKTSNGFETVQLMFVGDRDKRDAGASGSRISGNLFERCDGESEIISIKSNGNTISGNTFRESLGGLVLRHGGENTVSGNFFLGNGRRGSSGVRLQGRDQTLANNYFHSLDGPAIAIMDGTEDNFYGRVERAKILHNTVVGPGRGMLIGINHSKYPIGLPPIDCEITGNLFAVRDARRGTTSEPVIALVNGDEPIDWSWSGNAHSGELGMAPIPGITAMDAALRQAESGVMIPTALTPRTDGPSSGITTDAFGQTRGTRPTVGAIEFTDEDVSGARGGPLTPADVGPDSTS